jgi:competence protein ComEC
MFKPIERLENGKKLKLIVIIFCLWSYAILAGLSASIVRAVAMFTAIAIGLASSRPTQVGNSLVISLFFLLLINPFYLFDVGFQLSYTAVFSIVWLQPIFSGFWKPKQKFLRYFWSLLTVTLAAQVGILPLTLFYFHQFPGLFFISSLVIIPCLGFILGFGFLIVVLALLNILPQFLASIYEIILKTLNNFVAFISSYEGLIVQNISFSMLLLVAFYSFLICSVLWLKNRSIKNLLLVLIAIIFIECSLIFEKFQIESTNEFVVFHQSKISVFGTRTGKNMVVFQRSDSLFSNPYSPVNSYKNKLNINIIINSKSKNILNFDSKIVLIIDSTAIYTGINMNPEIVFLINSPKINLERMIEIIKPKSIIVDGSNYRSYVTRWKRSCQERSVQFYNTSVNGAYMYNYRP